MNSKFTAKLTKEEKQIDKDLTAGRFRSLGPESRERYARLARDDLRHRKTERKEERINIRLTSKQLQMLKERAEQEGLPYQSLIASVIQKYLIGSLVEVASLAAMKRILKAL